MIILFLELSWQLIKNLDLVSNFETIQDYIKTSLGISWTLHLNEISKLWHYVSIKYDHFRTWCHSKRFLLSRIREESPETSESGTEDELIKISRIISMINSPSSLDARPNSNLDINFDLGTLGFNKRRFVRLQLS